MYIMINGLRWITGSFLTVPAGLRYIRCNYTAAGGSKRFAREIDFIYLHCSSVVKFHRLFRVCRASVRRLSQWNFMDAENIAMPDLIRFYFAHRPPPPPPSKSVTSHLPPRRSALPRSTW